MFAFKFNLRRYNKAQGNSDPDYFSPLQRRPEKHAGARQVHTLVHFNLSRFLHKMHPRHPLVPAVTC